MVSNMSAFVLLYLEPVVPQAISKKAGKKAATPKKGGAKAATKVAKVRYSIIRLVCIPMVFISIRPIGRRALRRSKSECLT